MNLRQAAQQALEALEALKWKGSPSFVKDAITSLRQALAEPEQEPVALPCCGYANASAVKWNPHNQVVQCHNCGQIYTAPTPRKPLTDEQKPSGSFVLWENTLCNPLADARSMAHSAWHDGYASGVKAEREECAKILDGAPRLVPSLQFPGGHCFVCGLNSEKIAEAIRSRT